MTKNIPPKTPLPIPPMMQMSAAGSDPSPSSPSGDTASAAAAEAATATTSTTTTTTTKAAPSASTSPLPKTGSSSSRRVGHNAPHAPHGGSSNTALSPLHGKVEEAIRRYVMPEIQALKEEQEHLEQHQARLMRENSKDSEAPESEKGAAVTAAAAPAAAPAEAAMGVSSRPHPPLARVTRPKLRLEARDLCHEGASVFFENVHAGTILSDTVETVLSILYRASACRCCCCTLTCRPSPAAPAKNAEANVDGPTASSSAPSTASASDPVQASSTTDITNANNTTKTTTTTTTTTTNTTPSTNGTGSGGREVGAPSVRSVTLILRSMDGIAYTTGTELDDEHKEIHFSLEYLAKIAQELRPTEIAGVLAHEMVHVWQWNGRGTAPGGLIEGIADFVRLRAGLSPPHWQRPTGGRDKDARWDAGYDGTAFFLDWLDDRVGGGAVAGINRFLRDDEYSEDMWKRLFGDTVDNLFEKYQLRCDLVEK